MKVIPLGCNSFSVVEDSLEVDKSIYVTQEQYNELVLGTMCFDEELTTVIVNEYYVAPEETDEPIEPAEE